VIRLRVKEVALQKGVSQGLLSRKSNIDVNTIRRILRDPDKVVTTETLNRLANALEVDVCELLEYSPDG
jgi:DNA-binding Xre family transcriptional regulator